MNGGDKQLGVCGVGTRREAKPFVALLRLVRKDQYHNK